MLDGLDDYGIDTNDFRGYVVSVGTLIFGFNAVVMVFSLFSTGCCRERFFVRPRSCCGFCLTFAFGPFAQGTFFVVCIVSTILSFLAVTLCMTCFLVASFVQATCVAHLNVQDANGTDVAVQGKDIVAQIVRTVKMPRMIHQIRSEPPISTYPLGRSYDSFSASDFVSFLFYVLFTLTYDTSFLFCTSFWTKTLRRQPRFRLRIENIVLGIRMYSVCSNSLLDENRSHVRSDLVRNDVGSDQR